MCDAHSLCDACSFVAIRYMNGLPSNDSAIRVVAPQDNPFHVWKEQARDGNHLNL